MSDRAVVEAYLSLVEEFLAGGIDARTFERRYLEAWRSAPPHGPGPLFDVLEGPIFRSTCCTSPAAESRCALSI